MTPIEHRVRVDSGEIAVIEYRHPQGAAADAVPVLFVHSTGLSASNWDVTAEHLGRGVAAYSVDLPGHGRSTAVFDTAEDGWRHLHTVVRELGLDRPLLVTHENSAFVTTVAALVEPDSCRGVLVVGGAILSRRDRALESIAFVNSDGFVEEMVPRFRFGETGDSPASAEALVVTLTEQATADWVMEDIGDRLRPEVERSIEVAEDGSWLHKPTLDTLRGMYTLAEDHPYMPDEHFYDALAVPVWTVELANGFEHPTDEMIELVRSHPLMRLVHMASGPWPQYEHPEGLADLVEAVAADPYATELPDTDGHAR